MTLSLDFLNIPEANGLISADCPLKFQTVGLRHRLSFFFPTTGRTQIWRKKKRLAHDWLCSKRRKEALKQLFLVVCLLKSVR